MATSKAKKERRKLVRQGKPDPEMLRGSWQGVSPVTKKTPELREKLNKLHSKHKRNHALKRSDDSFFFGA